MTTFDFRQQLFTNWNFIRVVRLLLSVIILFQSFQQHDWMIGFLGGIFLVQTILNTGCCGAGECALPASKTIRESEEIEFAEIKENKK